MSQSNGQAGKEEKIPTEGTRMFEKKQKTILFHLEKFT